MSQTADHTIAVAFRPAVATDCRDIAKFLCVAGGGLYEFLFDDLVPVLTAIDLLTVAAWGDHYPVSFRNCRLAFDAATGETVGVANVFPVDNLAGVTHAPVPEERWSHVQAMMLLQDPGSMFLNALAVSETCRGLGVGTQLLQWAHDCARDRGYGRLSLHVWSDNKPAVHFYKAQGFVELAVAPVEPHPRLPHRGGSILMRRTIADEATKFAG